VVSLGSKVRLVLLELLVLVALRVSPARLASRVLLVLLVLLVHLVQRVHREPAAKRAKKGSKVLLVPKVSVDLKERLVLKVLKESRVSVVMSVRQVLTERRALTESRESVVTLVFLDLVESLVPREAPVLVFQVLLVKLAHVVFQECRAQLAPRVRLALTARLVTKDLLVSWDKQVLTERMELLELLGPTVTPE